MSTQTVKDVMRVLLVDDHEITRRGIRLLVDTLDDVRIVGEASTGIEAVELCRALEPDLVLMDLEMPEMGGIEAIGKIIEEMPEVRVLVLSVHEDGEAVYEAIRAGARGYVPKAATADSIGRALDALRSGGAFLSPDVAKIALRHMSDKLDSDNQAAAVKERTTPREREIMELLAEGLPSRAIGSRLGISPRTVNGTLSHIYRRLRVNNRVSAVREAIRLGIIEEPAGRPGA